MLNPWQSLEEEPASLASLSCSLLRKLRHRVKIPGGGGRPPPWELASLPARHACLPHGSSYIHMLESVLALHSPDLKGFVRTAVPSECTVPSISQTVKVGCGWDHSKPQVLGAQQRPGPAAEAEHRSQGKSALWRRQSLLENWLRAI